MPTGPGTYGGGGRAGLAGAATARQGIPQRGVMPTSAPDRQAISEIMQMLRGGQVGAEKFLQLLELLAGSTVPGMGGGPQQAQGAQGQQQTAGRGGGGAAPSIQSLLGG